MMRPRVLLEAPVTYDIIIGDFGRDATIEYLRLMAASEKELIGSILHRQHEFFDEYRRIMFSVIGDVAFFKRPAIADHAANVGFLTEDILVGAGFTPMSSDLAGRVALSVAQEALAAFDRGYRRLRVALPCNGLHGLAKEVGRLLHSIVELRALFNSHDLVSSDFERLAAAEITIHTVPEAALRRLVASREPDGVTNLLVLGTPGANAIYAELADSSDIKVVPMNSDDYTLISQAIVASIGGDPAVVTHCREQLQMRLIAPLAAQFEGLVTLEACTDFRLGLGLSSLQLFADEMVADWYRANVFSENTSPPERSGL
jgi:hypothetical protein